MKNTGDGRRVQRVEKEVQQAIAEFLIKGYKNPLPGLVTVSLVKMPADLKTAKVYIGVFGTEEQKSQVVQSLQDHASRIQRFIGNQLRMRYCPKLTFYPDKTTEQMMKIDKILHQIAEEKKLRENSSADSNTEE